MTIRPNQKDSMKSTWPLWERSQWGIHHKLIDKLDAYPLDLDNQAPVHSKDTKIPHLPQWPQHLWVLTYASIPLIIHQAWASLSGLGNLGKIPTFFLYFMSFNFIIVREIQILRGLGNKYGFLDGDQHQRDGVPDAGVGKVTASLWKTTGSRLILTTLISYDPTQNPAVVMIDPKWWLWTLLAVGLYSIVLDFWFYWYHRVMHDIGFLWKYHRTHHLTKHPNTLMSAYADHEQEFFDMVCVPGLTYLTFWAMGVPLGFYDWWICHQYVAFTEIWGHSGLRVHLAAPSTLYWLLYLLNSEIVVEDHDLHHRRGYRKSSNYGKQTRLWDRVFGTMQVRIESAEENIDWINKAYMPLFG